MKICSLCEKKVNARGLCNLHYYHYRMENEPDFREKVRIRQKRNRQKIYDKRSVKPRTDKQGNIVGRRYLLNHIHDYFKERIFVDEKGCWIWKLKLTREGYGKCQIKQLVNGNKAMMAHRASYEFYKQKKIADGLVLDHLCRKPACVNPDHLEEVTHKENHERGSIGSKFHLYKDWLRISR